MTLNLIGNSFSKWECALILIKHAIKIKINTTKIVALFTPKTPSTASGSRLLLAKDRFFAWCFPFFYEIMVVCFVRPSNGRNTQQLFKCLFKFDLIHSFALWRLLFGDFLRLTFVVIFVNYFCLQNLIFLNFGKKFFLTILRSVCLEFCASNYMPQAGIDSPSAESGNCFLNIVVASPPKPPRLDLIANLLIMEILTLNINY